MTSNAPGENNPAAGDAPPPRERFMPKEVEGFLADWRAEIANRQVYFEAEERAANQWIEARERMDYWLTGMAGAVLAYAIQSYDAATVPIGRWLAPVSWALLLLAVGMGVRSLALLNRVNFARMMKTRGERQVKKNEASLERQAVWSRFGIAQPVDQTPEEIAEAEALTAEVNDVLHQVIAVSAELERTGEETMSRYQAKSVRAARWRSILLVGGLLVLATLRVLNLST